MILISNPPLTNLAEQDFIALRFHPQKWIYSDVGGFRLCFTFMPGWQTLHRSLCRQHVYCACFFVAEPHPFESLLKFALKKHLHQMTKVLFCWRAVRDHAVTLCFTFLSLLGGLKIAKYRDYFNPSLAVLIEEISIRLIAPQSCEQLFIVLSEKISDFCISSSQYSVS